MSDHTSIEWTDRTWNPVRGCSRVSEGCRNCYAERFAARFAGADGYMHGFVANHSADLDAGGFAKWRWTGKVELVPEKLAEPLSWRKPQRVFVNSMSDLFHESLPDDAIDRVFAVMALAPQHTFQVLTKRPERMREYMALDLAARAGGWCRHDKVRNRASDLARTRGKLEQLADDVDLNMWPLPNVWLGVSIEDQESADERIPLLLNTPAAIRFASAEPLLGPVDLRRVPFFPGPLNAHDGSALFVGDIGGFEYAWSRRQMLHWVIVGGESGPRARSCNVAWIRSIVEQCKSASVAVFVKQLGANCWDATNRGEWFQGCSSKGAEEAGYVGVRRLRDRKGGDMAEWPEELRVREFPTAVRA